MVEIAGRVEELASLEAFLAAPEAGSTLVLEGEPGIGKTVLWQAGVERASELSYRVLVTRPTEAESALPFSGLADLLDGTFETAVENLPEPQRIALEVALLRAASPQERMEELALDRAVLATLRTLAEEQPTVIAIDDVQWLDAPTGRVLSFALRRASDMPVQLLASRRTGEASALDVGGQSSAGSMRRLELGPLSLDELGELLPSRLGVHIPRPRLRELHVLSRGNPYYALELARPVRDWSIDTLHVAGTLQSALGERLAALPVDCADALVLVAASPAITEAQLVALTGSKPLAEAVAAEVLCVEADGVRFTHPLLASIAYDDASVRQRRAAHRRLSAIASRREERALHRALAADTPDESLAAELELASEETWARGAPETAARLLGHAVRLTPTARKADAVRRMTLAAEHLQTAGDYGRATTMFVALRDRLASGPQRARVLARLANLEPDREEAVQLQEEALAEAGDELTLKAGIHVSLYHLVQGVGDLESALEHAAEATSLAERDGDRRLIAVALTALGYSRCLLGLGGLDDLERALELERAPPDRERVYYPRTFSARLTLGLALAHVGELDRARTLIHQELERSEATGQEMYRAHILERLALLELRAGDWAAAVRHATDGLALARQATGEHVLLGKECVAALVDAHLGRVDEAIARAEAGVASAERIHDALLGQRFRAVLGFVELSRGNPAAADVWLAPALEVFRVQGAGFQPPAGLETELEALVTIGELERAEELAGLIEHRRDVLGQAWADAVAARGHALVLAARGDVEGARRGVERALAAHERLRNPFEHARTLLVQGAIERRAKRKRAARLALELALEIFDQLGAPLWAERAAGELARIGGRRPAGSELTPTERRVAELVGNGLSNKEVASALFVRPHTVEGHLSRIYEKLGIRSRTELASRMTRELAAHHRE